MDFKLRVTGMSSKISLPRTPPRWEGAHEADLRTRSARQDLFRTRAPLGPSSLPSCWPLLPPRAVALVAPAGFSSEPRVLHLR